MIEKVLYVFDFDDTLFETPKMTEFLSVENGKIKTDDENIIKYFEKIKGIFSVLFFKEISFEERNTFIVLIDNKKNIPLGSEYVDFINDLDVKKISDAGLKSGTKKELIRMVEEKNGLLILKPFPGFFEDARTIGKIVNPEVKQVYKKADNKMILTGRREGVREEIEKSLINAGLEMPNFGIHLFKQGNKSISDFKTETIINSIIENGWQVIHFYEDREDWLLNSQRIINEKFPQIKFFKHLVTNIKNKFAI